MNSRLVLTLVPLAGFLLSGCDKPQPQAAAPAKTAPAAEPAPLPPPPPAPAEPSESEQRLEAQMQAMQDRQAELQRQLDEEKLARLEAEIAQEREMLEKEREAWRLEQELADAKANAARPKAATQVGGDVVNAGYSSAGRYDYQTFYDDLAPYGAWYDSPDYGYVWQPSVYVGDTSWRPYTVGSWAHCDAGWTWCSDEPFGWATYHYGRWARCRQRGWIWVPGDVWAPAWVSWRRSDSHVGWCPLPPETVYHRNVSWGVTVDTDCGIHPSMYIFMPVRHFDRPVLRYCEPAAVSFQICATTTNITNVFWRSGRVHCDGPKYDWIRSSVQRPVPQYTLAWDQGRPVNGRPAHRMEKDRLHVFAPKMDVPWNRTLQPRSKAGRLEETQFVRAESGVPQKMQEQFRREKASREQAAGSSKAGRYVMERQQRLEEMERSRQTLAAETQKLAEAAKATPADRSRPDRFPGKSGRVVSAPPQTEGDAGKLQPATPPQPEASIPDARPIANKPVNEDLRRQKEAEQFRAMEQAKSTPVTPPSAGAAEAALAEKQRLAAESAARNSAARADAKAGNDRARMEALRRERDEAAQQAAAERAAAQEQQKRAAETAARNEAATRELENQKAQRAQLEEQRRRSEAAKEQAEAQRTSSEKARRDNNADTRERTRAAMDERRRQQEESQAAQARAEAKRAELENQRRQAEAARAAEQAARQREAMEQQRRQAQAEAAREQQRRAAEESAARQREAMENQRRQAQAEAAREQQRRAAEESAARQREAMENQRRQAEENSRRQAAENAQREAMDKARRASEEAERRQSEDRGGRRGK